MLKKFDYQLIRRLSIVGSGALATFYALKWRAYCEVSVLGTWQESILSFNTELKIPAYTNWHEAKEPDIVVWLTKAYKNEVLLDKYNCLNWSCPILILQNGIGQRELFKSKLNKNQALLRGVTSQGAKLISPGLVENTGDGDVFVESHIIFNNFPVIQVQNIEDVVLKKLAINAVLNPVTALFEVKNGNAIKGEPFNQVKKIVSICFPFFEKRGIYSTEKEYLNDVIKTAQSTAENMNSMLSDKQSGRMTEIHQIMGEISKEVKSDVIDRMIIELS